MTARITTFKVRARTDWAKAIIIGGSCSKMCQLSVNGFTMSSHGDLIFFKDLSGSSEQSWQQKCWNCNKEWTGCSVFTCVLLGIEWWWTQINYAWIITHLWPTIRVTGWDLSTLPKSRIIYSEWLWLMYISPNLEFLI